MHAGAFVQARRPGRVLCVHAETDARLAAAVELAEGVEQQREAEAAPSPLLADAAR
jgi:hypothetical protein